MILMDRTGNLKKVLCEWAEARPPQLDMAAAQSDTAVAQPYLAVFQLDKAMEGALCLDKYDCLHIIKGDCLHVLIRIKA